MGAARSDGRGSWAWAAAAGVVFALAFFLAPFVGPLAALLKFFARESHPFIHYFYRGRENLYLPDWGVRVALFLYPAAFCFALAGASSLARLRWRVPAAWFAGRRRYAWLYGAGLALLLATAWFVFGGVPHEFDETAYILQARIFAHGRLWADRPACDRVWEDEGQELNNFFVGLSRLEVLNGDKWFTIYSPLHPLLLAFGFLARAPWVVNPVCAAAAPALLVALAAAMAGPRVVPWAAALALTSPFWLFNGASFMSEGTWLPLFVLFLLLTWRAFERPSRGGFFAAGVVLGLAVLDREWATFVSALPFLAYAGYLLLRKRDRRPEVLFLALGALPFVVVYYLYNVALTGDPFKFIRGFSRQQHFGFDEAHTPAVAVDWIFRNLYTLSSDMFGWPLFCLVPLALYAVVVRPLPLFAKLFYAGWAAVFAGNLFIENAGIIYGPRYYMGLFPGAVVLTAHLASSLPAWLARRRPFAAAGAGAASSFVKLFFAALVMINLACYLPFGVRKHHGYPFKYKPWVTPRLAQALAAANPGPFLVFVKPREIFRGPMPNDPALDAPIIYARDQAWRDVEVMKMFPGRRYFVCDYGDLTGPETIMEVTPPWEKK